MVRDFSGPREGWALHGSMAFACAFAAVFAADAMAGGATGCNPTAVGPASVRSVADGRTLTLSDGREVRLAGIEIPSEIELGTAARAALERLVHGNDVRL